jgi:CRP-like cAMP-binding protein
MTLDIKSSQANLLLKSISEECGLRDWLEPVNFPVGHEIASPHGPLNYFYFPTGGVLSTMVHLRGGASAETLTIGNEGMVGVPIWLGISRSFESVLQQIAGEVIRIPARAFCRRIVGHRRTERLIKRFTAYSLRSGAQTTVCNSHHSIRQRVCRWLLTLSDRSDSNRLTLTHSVLAQTLGVRRQSVTEIAHKLQSAGILRYRRGEIELCDRLRLEHLACECYQEIKRLYDRWVRAAL